MKVASFRRIRAIAPGLIVIAIALVAGGWFESWTGSRALGLLIGRPDVMKLLGGMVASLAILGVFRLIEGPFRISFGPVKIGGGAAALLCWGVCLSALIALDVLL